MSFDDRGQGTGTSGVIPAGVLGMLLFVGCEIMFFAGLISARFVASASLVGWPPLGQPRLPIATTACNSLILLASGVVLYTAQRLLSRSAPWGIVMPRIRLAIGLGAAFVLFQGIEWARLLHYGLTLQSSAYGSFFYLIIGAHAVHVMAALLVLALVSRGLDTGRVPVTRFWAAQVFWYFVVALWPVLYVLVYIV